MASYRIRTEAKATVEELWIIDTPEGVTITDADALEIIAGGGPEGVRLRQVTDTNVHQEHDREVLKVETI